MNPHLIFNIIVLILALFILGESIASIYFYQTMYNGGGTPDIGKTSCLVMTILNILLLIFAAGMILWTIVRLFDKNTNGVY